jgi:uncharacterized protein YkwD
VLLAAAVFLHTRASALELRIRNDFGSTLSTAVLYYDDASGEWRTRGWYTVRANSSETFGFTTSKPDIYLHSYLSGGGKWGEGDVTRVVIADRFNYRDGEECPAGRNRRTEKFTKYTAGNNVVNYRPVDDSAPLPNAGASVSGGAARASVAGDGLARSAADVVKLINYDRARAGVKELTSGEAINNAARTRARELTRKDDLEVRPDGRNYGTVLTDNGIAYAVAYSAGSTFRDDDPIGIFQAFNGNAPTRGHMMSADYTDIGVGIYERNGTYYCVQLLCGPVAKEEEKDLVESWKELEQSLKELGEIFK